MEEKELKTDSIAQALPTSFNFYHLGKVELRSPEFQEISADTELASSCRRSFKEFEQDFSAIGFQIQGDLVGWLVIFYPKQLDHSTYSELGNILVSKMVTHLSSHAKMDVYISPPMGLSSNLLEKLSYSESIQHLSSYIHYQEGNLIPIEIWFQSASPEEIGNA